MFDIALTLFKQLCDLIVPFMALYFLFDMIGILFDRR